MLTVRAVGALVRLFFGTVDEVQQGEKWRSEHVERAKPRKEPSLDEFLKAFDMAPPEQKIEFQRDNPTAKVLSPVLDGHEAARARRAKLLLQLEEAVPDSPKSPPNFALPPAFSDA